MTQPLFEVQTFDGHGWVTLHRGTDLDAAGDSARRVLPEAKRHAVRILKQSFDAERSTLDSQVVFSLGKPRKPVVRRALGVAAAFSASLAAIVAATMIHSADPGQLVALVADTPELAAAEPVPHRQFEALIPAAGHEVAFNCEREAARGLIRASNIAPEREALYALCADAAQGDAAAQVALGARLAAGDGVGADPAQAIEWYQQAARAGHIEAYRPLGDLLLAAGDGNAERGIAWQHRAALAGDTDAARALAHRYRAGDGVAADPRIALSYDLIAAEAGDAAAMLRAADAFATGTGTESDPDAAQRWLARAADAGADAHPIAAVQTADAGAAAPVQLELAWAPPVLADSGATAGQSPISLVSPGPASALDAPALQLDLDHDARELGTGFADGAALASV